jgi:hypothetical protein
MLEIVALIFLTKKIGNIAIRKNLNPSTWKLYTVLAWFGGEILGIGLGLTVFGLQDFFPLTLMGLGFAYTAYYIVHTTLEKMPDNYDDIDSLGDNPSNE